VRDNLYEAVIDQDVVGPGLAIASGSPFKNMPRPKAPPPLQPLTPRRRSKRVRVERRTVFTRKERGYE
jgi:hypothetical protein